MTQKIQASCDSIQQNKTQYVARFIVAIPDAETVENKLPVKSIFTAQFAGKENRGFLIGEDYEITIKAMKEK